MLHTKFGKDWTRNSWEEDVNRQRTKDDDGYQPIAKHVPVGHLSDSDDQINVIHYEWILLHRSCYLLWSLQQERVGYLSSKYNIKIKIVLKLFQTDKVNW